MICDALKMRAFEEENEIACTTDYEYYAADLVIKQPDKFYCALFEEK